MDFQAVLDFVDSGHDLILAAGASASDLVRSIARQCGVNFDEVCCIVHNLVNLDEWMSLMNMVLIWCRIHQLWLSTTPITQCWGPKGTIH